VYRCQKSAEARTNSPERVEIGRLWLREFSTPFRFRLPVGSTTPVAHQFCSPVHAYPASPSARHVLLLRKSRGRCLSRHRERARSTAVRRSGPLPRHYARLHGGRRCATPHQLSGRLHPQDRLQFPWRPLHFDMKGGRTLVATDSCKFCPKRVESCCEITAEHCG